VRRDDLLEGAVKEPHADGEVLRAAEDALYYSEYSYAADATPEEAAPADAAPADADYYDIEYDYSEYSDDGATANMTELLHVDEYAAPAPEPSLSRVPVSGTLVGLHVK